MKTPKGTCQRCGASFTGRGVSRHLQTCLGPGERLLIKVTSPHEPHWLAFSAAQSATLAELDRALRDVWLECCGHLSAFEIDGA